MHSSLDRRELPAPLRAVFLDITLDRLARLPVERRCAAIIQGGKQDVYTALAALAEQEAPIGDISLEHVAWAVASNVDGGNRRGLGYIDYWPKDTRWRTVWSTLTTPRPSGSGQSETLLQELTLSVACEHRPGWRAPWVRPAETYAARATLEWIRKRDTPRILDDIRDAFEPAAAGAADADADIDPNAIADEAWARVFCDYWSAQAQRRFLGLSTIATLVSEVARQIVSDNRNVRGNAPAAGTGLTAGRIMGPAVGQLRKKPRAAARRLASKP
jgi:hypothetical protein